MGFLCLLSFLLSLCISKFTIARTVNYRPQRSCGKVMFLHLSVILFMGESLSRGVSVQRGSLSRGVSVWGSLSRETPHCHTVTCGRYASYWNAFLLKVDFVQLIYAVYSVSSLTPKNYLSKGWGEMLLVFYLWKVRFLDFEYSLSVTCRLAGWQPRL